MADDDAAMRMFRGAADRGRAVARQLREDADEIERFIAQIEAFVVGPGVPPGG
jgi:hypothetical protein